MLIFTEELFGLSFGSNRVFSEDLLFTWPFGLKKLMAVLVCKEGSCAFGLIMASLLNRVSV